MCNFAWQSHGRIVPILNNLTLIASVTLTCPLLYKACADNIILRMLCFTLQHGHACSPLHSKWTQQVSFAVGHKTYTCMSHSHWNITNSICFSLAIVTIMQQYSKSFTKPKTRCTELFTLICLSMAFALCSTSQLYSPHEISKVTKDNSTTSCQLLVWHLCPSAIGACLLILHTSRPRPRLLFTGLSSSSSLPFASSSTSRLPHMVATLLHAQFCCVSLCRT